MSWPSIPSPSPTQATSELHAGQIIGLEDPILVTGAAGFIGSRVVRQLVERGFREVRALVRDSQRASEILERAPGGGNGAIRLFEGNVLSPGDCEKAAQGVALVYHLAAGMDKSFASAYMTSVVGTKNLLEALIGRGSLRRFVNVSSIGVYTNRGIPRGGLLDESCPVESHPIERGEAYLYGKIKQDQLVTQYARSHGFGYVILRPGVVFGPGKRAITGRVGIDTFGFFLHLGGSNRIPFTYVDNCAKAIALAGVTPGVDGQVFNVVDDDLPTSREFLRAYKEKVGGFFSIPVPYHVFYVFCLLWEAYSRWSNGQLAPVFNRYRCSADWKGNCYSNRKLKELLGWEPDVPIAEALKRYFDYMMS